MAIGSPKLSEQGAITKRLKRMTAIGDMAGMDVLCSDKIGTLTLNKLTVDKNLIDVFIKGVDKDYVMLLAAKAAMIENQDAIDACMLGMLADPKEAQAGIREVHFLPFNPVDKRTTLTYIDANENWHRAKGAPEQIITLYKMYKCKEVVKRKFHSVINSYAECGLRSLAGARQRRQRKVQEVLGSLLVYCRYLILRDMTVLKQLGEL